jgi:hypothetical protein
MEYEDSTFPDTFIAPATLRRSFTVLAWNDAVRERIMSYWRTRDFAFTQSEGSVLIASRGDPLTLPLSIRADHLPSSLTIERSDPAEIICTLTVNTFQMFIPDWGRLNWWLEMETFASFLQRDDLREEEWREFRRDDLRAFLLFTFTLGLRGKDLSEKWIRRIQRRK